ncbi:hypothetical protein SU69_07435 [Thermosipho melanesiensis]|uniref:NYN domain-containing protein n=2 Tax=Thermosipho melanesiensis TaxID=46541 RepID=A6LN11_THEM4|nr:NYN domain-containing protein [Thermosipho melanesiensis]ABR31312.1 protein of unknown function DUF88 [Thermosipho melanesiensis BI429]APT74911.1 hypothetical protein BW47_07770 [Thermosipho melanesiensis]OOC36333.1 hypothetical protein SU68_07505 [Thermosipho melanesiensis]OOC37151.1 hypothetical protein SU69_07435 [Thermosipho melanesiensis]OOC37903.1 hypothetical protein SU70_07445 [Thermosipho melanesiensis]
MRAIIIVDGNYLYKSCMNEWKKAPKYDFCFQNIIKFYSKVINTEMHLIRVRFHDSPPCEGGDNNFRTKKEKVLNKLRSIQRIDVVLGRCRKIGNTFSQKGVDVNMALDIVRYANDIDTIIIISGDSDLVPAFDEARNRGAEIVLLLSPHHFNSTGSADESIKKLIVASDFYFTFDDKMMFNTSKNYTP